MILDTGCWILDMNVQTSQNVIEYRESSIEYHAVVSKDMVKNIKSPSKMKV